MSLRDQQQIARGEFAFLSGGGEMGQRTRSFDWSQTPLGPMETWPQSLKIAVRIMLESRYAMWLGWGPEFTFFYNDAYAQMTLGPKHPWALGRSTRDVWPEIWDDIGPRAEAVVRTGNATWDEGLLLLLERRGFQEETYHTFSYSPLPDDAGGIGGMLCVVTEETERTLGERRLRTLRELAARTTGEAKSVGEACQTAAHTLAENPLDLPFVLIYLLDADARSAQLAATAGLPDASPAAPERIDLVDSNGHPPAWPLRTVLDSGQAEIVTELEKRFGSLPGGAWPDAPRQAVVLPIAKPGQTRLAGFLVAGVSPRLVLNDAYRGFFDLLAGQVGTAVTNARAYEEERQRAEALAELDRAKTAFFSNVSHEFRTPLTLMLGPVEDLLARSQTDLSPVAARQLEVVNRNGLRLLRLVNTLLDFSRIEAGRVRALFQPTDLSAFTAELASVFRSACERAGLRLAVNCPPLAEPVFVDREMWEKIVLNLLSNAFKFTFEGEIVVTLGQADGRVELRVQDTGTGIPADELPRLFERFHRIENAKSRTHEGSGIGLALVQELVKLHSGSITAHSRPGQGTTFIVSVPLGSAHLQPEQIASGRTVTTTGPGAAPYVEEALRWLPDENRGDDRAAELPIFQETLATPYLSREQQEIDDRPRVLVADDNADMRRYVVRLLTGQYRVEAVPDGEAALALARSAPPDLILTDVMMPRLDGFGLLRELRADPRTQNLPVILLSARAGEESRVEGMEAGADDYLVKPFSARELLARVTAHLQMARLRREASETLRESEERLRMALTAGRMVAWQFNPATDEVVWENATEVFGLLPGSVLENSKQGFALLHPDDMERHRATVMKAVEERGSYLSQFRMIRPDDQRCIWLEERGQAVSDGAGKAVRLIGVVTDITERKRAEEALLDADRKKDEFLATLAHELRNPLAPLRNGLQVMKLASHEDGVVEESRAIMERQLGQMIRLIDDLLDLSRISQGKVELKTERCGLARVIENAVETVRPVIEQSNHQLAVVLPPNPLYVDGDATRLAQVFANLLNNAAKFTSPGGQIGLTVERQGSDAVVKIKDNGVGIPAQMLGTIFEMFTQVDRSLEKSQGGLGIGLTLVKRLIEMHGGSVAAHSEGQGLGSEFVVRLPLNLSVVEKRPVKNDTVMPTSRRRVLVVDDNQDAATSLAMMLKIMGNDTRTAYDGLEALNVASQFEPDLVMLDIGMPRLNGYDAARRIREQPWGKDVVLVALTGWGQDEDRRKSQEAGFDTHLVKPIELAALEKLLAGRPVPRL